MKILHFGDLHVWRWSFDWSDPLYPKRLLGFVNLGLRRRHKFPPALGPACIDHILTQSDIDVVIFTGDFSTMSLDAEFEEAARLVAPIRERWGDRFLHMPGNHDRYSPRTLHRYDHWFPDGTLPNGVRTWELGDNTVVVGYDASRPFKIRSNGDLTPDLEAKLDAELKRQTAAGRHIILIGHYPYATLPEHPESWEHKLLGEERLAALVAKHKPPVYLHGHKHVRWQIRPPETPDTLCINCGSAGMKSDSSDRQAGYATFDFVNGKAENVTFQTVSLP